MLDGFTAGQTIDDLGNGERDSGADDDGVHTGEHRPVDRREEWRFDLVQEVDPDPAVVA